MTSQLCSRQRKEITMLDIIETFENFKDLNKSPITIRVSNVVIFNLVSLLLYDMLLFLIISRVALFCTLFRYRKVQVQVHTHMYM